MAEGYNNVLENLSCAWQTHTDHPFNKTLSETVTTDFDNHFDAICACILQCFTDV